MRLLLLAFSILVFPPQVIPAYGGEKKCWHKSGYCRKTCRVDKVIKTVCQHYQVCCVPNQKVPITSPTPILNFQTNIIDILVTSLTTPSFEISTENKEDEKSDSELET
uniref:LOW QUALITY PROTEIN: beta-defensin 118 n=1 Tax=Halichoerus grypus TaxID=9711 RepID=UPI001659234D|nr:LOW QUALITY PROTEIN: beta-defensin 118 [Halichoerus grypus]